MEENNNENINYQPNLDYSNDLKYELINKIQELKINLFNTDYQAIKHSEGLIGEEDYFNIKIQRQN